MKNKKQFRDCLSHRNKLFKIKRGIQLKLIYLKKIAKKKTGTEAFVKLIFASGIRNMVSLRFIKGL